MIRAFQWDLARQVERLDWLIAQLPRYADWGYQELYLHLEDAVHYPSLPGVGRADAYTYQEMARLVATAERAGIAVVPIANLLGHTQYLIKVPELRDLNELRADDGSPLERGQLCPLHPRTLEVAEKLLGDLAPFCTAGKVHVGLDESFHLGRHPLSRAEIAERGLAAHFAGYVNRLTALTGKLDLRLGLWADMLYYIPEAIPLLPRGTIAYDWYYYPFKRHPRVELFNFAEQDLVPAFRAQGIEYWGCPMNGAFRYEPLPVFGERLANLRSWWERCQRTGAEGFLVTSWEAYRLALEMTTVVDAAAASLWLEPKADNSVDLLAHGFERTFGRKGARKKSPATAARAWARAALACDERAFAGYARWEINSRWDVMANREGLAGYEAEARFFARLHTHSAAQHWPAAFMASVGFRYYLAERDVFVRRAARAVFRLRRLLHKTELQLLPKVARPPARVVALFAALRAEAAAFAVALRSGRTAARAMWRRTRDPQAHGHNEMILAADEARLAEWREWLIRAAAEPDLVWKTTPLCGAWQLQFTVHNVAPALQKVVVEQQQPNGDWRDLHARFTVEFRARAAQPRTKLRREFSTPIEDPSLPLRIAVRGLGQVVISHVALTNGVRTVIPQSGTPGKTLGKPAPRKGFPRFSLTENEAERPLRFSREQRPTPTSR